MKHLNPNLDNITNIEVGKMPVGNVRAIGVDDDNDVVLNTTTTSTPDGGLDSEGDVSAGGEPIGTIICDGGDTFDSVAENGIAGGEFLEYSFFNASGQEGNNDGTAFGTAFPRHIGVNDDPNAVESSFSFINSILNAANITAPATTTVFTVAGGNMDAFDLVYNQEVDEGSFAVTVSSVRVAVNSGTGNVASIRLGGTGTTIIGSPSFDPSDFAIEGTGTFRQGNGTRTDARASFVIGCTNVRRATTGDRAGTSVGDDGVTTDGGGITTMGMPTCTGGTDFTGIPNKPNQTRGDASFTLHRVSDTTLPPSSQATLAVSANLDFDDAATVLNRETLAAIRFTSTTGGVFGAGQTADWTAFQLAIGTQAGVDLTTLTDRDQPTASAADGTLTPFDLTITQGGGMTFTLNVKHINFRNRLGEVWIAGGGPLLANGNTRAGTILPSDYTIQPSGTYTIGTAAVDQVNVTLAPVCTTPSITVSGDDGDTTTTINTGGLTTTGDVNVGGDLNTSDGTFGPFTVTQSANEDFQAITNRVSLATASVNGVNVALLTDVGSALGLRIFPDSVTTGNSYSGVIFTVAGTEYTFNANWTVVDNSGTISLQANDLNIDTLVAGDGTTTWNSLEPVNVDDATTVTFLGTSCISTGSNKFQQGSGTLTTYDVASGSVISSTRNLIMSTGLNEIRIDGSGIDKAASDDTPLGLVVGDNGHIMTTTSGGGLTLPTANNTILANNGDSTALVASAITQTFTPAEEGEDEVTTIIGGSSLTINPSIVNIPTFSDIARDNIVTNDRLLFRNASGELARSSAVEDYFPTAGEVPSSWDNIGTTVNATANNIPVWDGDSFEDSPIALTLSSSSFTFDLAIPFTGTVEQNQVGGALQQDSDLVIASTNSAFRGAVASGSLWSTVTYVHFDNTVSGSFWERTSNAAAAPFVQGITTDSFIVLYTDDNNWAVISPISTNQAANSLNVSIEASMGVTPTIGNQITIGFIPSATYPLPAVETTITGGLNVIGLPNAADDAAAATAGVPVNGLYRNGSQLMIRIS